MITLPRLESILAAFPRLTIALVGDLFLDRYLEIEHGTLQRSIETNLEAYQVGRVRNLPGALGTVMNNLTALGVGLLVPVSVIGDDGHGFDLRQQLKQMPIDPVHILSDPDRLTPTYTKPLQQQPDGTWRELNRIDVRSRKPLSQAASQQMCDRLQRVIQTSDGIIILDQIEDENCGVVDSRTRNYLKKISRQMPDKLFFVDSRCYLREFDFGVLKGNAAELTAAAGESGDDVEAIGRAAVKLSQQTKQTIYGTRGEQGTVVVRPGKETVHVKGYAVDGPIDIVGAGDNATSGIVASLLAGADEIEAAAIGNLIASITISQLGTTGTAHAQQVIARWHETHAAQ